VSDDDFATPVILVTGALRNVGAEVIRQLAARDVYVRAAVEDLGQARAMGWSQVELTAFAYSRPDPAAFTGVNRLLLVMPPGDFEAEESQIASLIDHAQRARIEHVVFVSSIGTENLHITGQWAVEQRLVESDMAYTILRSGWFFQNFVTNDLLREEIRRGVFRSAIGTARISGVDVRDVAAVAVAALTDDGHQNQIYTLGEHIMDSAYIAEMFSKVLKREIRVEYISEYEAAHHLRMAGESREVAKWWRIVYQLMRQGAYTASVADISRVLGRPSIPFKQFVQDYADTWR
jgi:uncharacterized protein YbjT (DUF2867 family)